MNICEDCLLCGRCDGACVEVDGGINEAFEKENDIIDYITAEGE